MNIDKPNIQTMTKFVRWQASINMVQDYIQTKNHNNQTPDATIAWFSAFNYIQLWILKEILQDLKFLQRHHKSLVAFDSFALYEILLWDSFMRFFWWCCWWDSFTHFGGLFLWFFYDSRPCEQITNTGLIRMSSIRMPCYTYHFYSVLLPIQITTATAICKTLQHKTRHNK